MLIIDIYAQISLELQERDRGGGGRDSSKLCIWSFVHRMSFLLVSVGGGMVT